MVQKTEASAPKEGVRGRWGQDRRLEFIDTRLLWDRRVNRSDLIGFFGISTQQASLDFASYLGKAPENLIYDSREKAYLATASFKPVFAKPDTTTYLAHVYALATSVLSPDLSFLPPPPSVAIVKHPTRTVDGYVLQEVLSAIKHVEKLKILYQSMSKAEPEQREVSPHAIAYDGHRWHVRAYCHLRQEYRDFVFARILKIERIGFSTIDPQDDAQWHLFVDVELGPHPGLKEGPRKAIMLDYGMTSDRLVVPSRAALLFYLLRRLGLDRDTSNSPADRQHIVLLNRAELAPYLPPSTS